MEFWDLNWSVFAWKFIRAKGDLYRFLWNEWTVWLLECVQSLELCCFKIIERAACQNRRFIGVSTRARQKRLEFKTCSWTSLPSGNRSPHWLCPFLLPSPDCSNLAPTIDQFESAIWSPNYASTNGLLQIFKRIGSSIICDDIKIWALGWSPMTVTYSTS